MTGQPKLSLVPPIVPDVSRRVPGDADWIADPETGYPDNVKRRAAFERKHPDAVFTPLSPGWDATVTIGQTRHQVHDDYDLGRLLDKLDALIAKEEQP